MLKETACLGEIGDFINMRYGLEFKRQQEVFRSAVEKRLESTRLHTLKHYLELLQQREEEALSLLKLLTVHETYFFREPVQLEALSEVVLPRLLKNGVPFIRMLSAGCSSGEEAYSLAMAALQLPGAGREWDFEVIGVDIDQAAIRKARAGVYGAYSFRGCPLALKSAFFQALGKERFAVRREVKRKVRFETLNLFAEKYPEWMEKMDVVFYRNVSIYFSAQQREQLFGRLAGLLKMNGCLFLSCTETLYHDTAVMTLVKNAETFYYRKEETTTCTLRSPLSAVFVPPKISRWKPQETGKPTARTGIKAERKKTERKARQEEVKLDCEMLVQKALKLVQDKEYDAASKLLDEIISVEPDAVKAYTLKANILLDRGQSLEAAEFCRSALKLDCFSLEAYLLLGMAAKSDAKNDAAMQHFKKAVYVSPECWLAHFFLAELYRSCDEKRYAAREYEVTMKILQQNGFGGHGLSVFQLSFQKDDVIRLCLHNMMKLKE